MDYIEPPPKRVPENKKPKAKFRKVAKKPQEDNRIVIQKAQIRDVEEILELINGFAASNLMLPRGSIFTRTSEISSLPLMKMFRYTP